MSTTAATHTTDRPRYRFSVDQYHRLYDAGLIGQGVELLRGVIYDKGRVRDGKPVTHRFTVNEYHEMIAKGILPEGTQAELIWGEVVEKMPQGDPHAMTLESLTERLILLLTGRASVRCQLPVVFAESEPEPDMTVCVLPAARGNRKPRPEHIHIIVEVADSSLSEDRDETALMYADAGIPEYWIVNLVDRIIEVYTDPTSTAYTTRTNYAAGQDVPVVIAGTTVGTIPVSGILP